MATDLQMYTFVPVEVIVRRRPTIIVICLPSTDGIHRPPTCDIHRLTTFASPTTKQSPIFVFKEHRPLTIADHRRSSCPSSSTRRPMSRIAVFWRVAFESRIFVGFFRTLRRRDVRAPTMIAVASEVLPLTERVLVQKHLLYTYIAS